MSDIVINGKTYNGVESITVRDTSGSDIKYTKGEDRLQWKCDNVKSLAYEFYTYKGTDFSILEGLDTSQATNTTYMFSSCSLLETVPLFDTSNVTNMNNMFSYSNRLKNVPAFNTSSVTNMSYMFNSCSSGLTEIALLDTNNVTDMSYMLNSCSSLTKATIPNTNSLINMSSIFSGCQKLTELNFGNTSKVTTMDMAFRLCSYLETIPELDMISKPSVSNVFMNCVRLKNLTVKNVQKSMTIGSGTTYGHLLTNASLLNTAQELWDNTDNAVSSSALKLTMSTASKTAIQSIYVKLVDVTDDMIAQDEYIANKKPCVECASTDEGAMTVEEYIISKNWQIA